MPNEKQSLTVVKNRNHRQLLVIKRFISENSRSSVRVNYCLLAFKATEYLIKGFYCVIYVKSTRITFFPLLFL